MWNARQDESQGGIKIAGRNINNLKYADDTTLIAESKEELKNLLMRVNEETEKAGLKINSQKTMIMASGPITSWQIGGEKGEKVEAGTDFIFWGSKITADHDSSHEIRRCLLLGKKTMTNLDRVLKSKDIIPTKIHIVKAMVFLVVMYRSESLSIKKAESQRTDAFELWCWKRLMRVPWTTNWSNQWIPKEINTDYSLEGLLLQLKLQYLGHVMQRADLEKTLLLQRLKATGEEGSRGWDE